MDRSALISVSDKTNVVGLAKSLTEADYKILATGNTAKLLKSSGVEVTEISNVTGFPEIFGGRVKTLHPKILGGILMRRDNSNDQDEADKNGIFPIDIVCVNLYPFVKTTENPESSIDEIVEQIDIGGPSLIRASAKNFKSGGFFSKKNLLTGNDISSIGLGQVNILYFYGGMIRGNFGRC